jgi:hypothetical protein
MLRADEHNDAHTFLADVMMVPIFVVEKVILYPDHQTDPRLLSRAAQHVGLSQRDRV